MNTQAAKDEESALLKELEMLRSYTQLYLAFKAVLGDQYSVGLASLIEKHKSLLTRFIRSQCIKTPSIERAIAGMNTNSVLVYITELALYGVFSPQEYLTFVMDVLKCDDSAMSFTPVIFVPDNKNAQIASFYDVGDIDSLKSKLQTYFGCDAYIQTCKNRTDVGIINSRATVSDFIIKYGMFLNSHVQQYVTIYGKKFCTTILSDGFVAKIFAPQLIERVVPIQKYCGEAYDLSPYDGKFCVYFLQLKDPDSDCYKYGITRHIRDRLSAHRRAIKFQRVVNIYVMRDGKSMADAEREFKKYANQKGIAVVRLKYTEVIQTNNMDEELKILEGIVAKHNNIEPVADEVRTQDIITNSNDELNVDEISGDAIIPLQPSNNTDSARQWINNNPPTERELKKEYYARYKTVNVDCVGDSIFGKLVLETGKYISSCSNGRNYWKNSDARVDDMTTRHNRTLKWIRENPPKNREKRTTYFARYVAENIDGLPENTFATVVPTVCNCRSLKSSGLTYWYFG